MIKRLHDERDIFDCGQSLAYVISPRIAGLETEIDNLLDDLAVFDPTCPTVRCRNGEI